MHLYSTRAERLSAVRRPANSGSQSCWRLKFCLVSLTLIILACGGGRPSSSSSRRWAHLPTLTPTPLATLAVAAESPAIATIVVQADQAVVPTPSTLEGASAPPPQEVPAQPTALANPDQPTAAAETAPVAEVAPANPASPVEAAPPEAPLAVDTPAPLPTETPLPAPTETAVPTATATPLPTDTPTVTPTPAAWTFGQIRVFQEGGELTIYGKLTNQTGAAQKIHTVRGTPLDNQGQIMAGLGEIEAYWPGYVLPPGAAVPFEVTGESDQGIGEFQWSVEAETSDEAPSQDFEFSSLETAEEEGEYCVFGELRNRGGQLGDYLLVILTVYDAEDHIIGFSEFEEYAPDWVEGDEALEIQLCAYPPSGPVGRYELQALGR